MKKWIDLVLVLICLLGLTSCNTNNQVKIETVSDFEIATFEYIEDDGYKLITSEIDSLDTFDSLLLKPSEMKIDEKWVYRITFNPREYSKNTEEFVVLFGEYCVSINATTYIGDDVPYSEILDWATAKYEFFDYELMDYDLDIVSGERK